jgi:hypothetical protein
MFAVKDRERMHHGTSVRDCSEGEGIPGASTPLSLSRDTRNKFPNRDANARQVVNALRVDVRRCRQTSCAKFCV